MKAILLGFALLLTGILIGFMIAYSPYYYIAALAVGGIGLILTIIGIITYRPKK